MNKYVKPGTIVEVKWGDAWAGSSWRPADEIKEKHKPAVCTNIGYVGLHNKVGISLHHGEGEFGDFAGQNFIPAGNIIKIKKVK